MHSSDRSRIQFTKVPEALLVLSVMDNQLSSLDSSQANLAGALREVWVSGNELTLLPPWLCDRSTIEYIDVSLTAQRTVPI